MTIAVQFGLALVLGYIGYVVGANLVADEVNPLAKYGAGALAGCFGPILLFKLYARIRYGKGARVSWEP